MAIGGGAAAKAAARHRAAGIGGAAAIVPGGEPDLDPVIHVLAGLRIVADRGAAQQVIGVAVVVADRASGRAAWGPAQSRIGADGSEVFSVAAGSNLRIGSSAGPGGMSQVNGMAGTAGAFIHIAPGHGLVFARQSGQRPACGCLDYAVAVEVAALAVGGTWHG